MSTGQSPILQARINEKKIELENLKELKSLSAAVAGQMSVLEEKLATLADGTEGIRNIYLTTHPWLTNGDWRRIDSWLTCLH
jgi:DASH complex subunit DAD2